MVEQPHTGEDAGSQRLQHFDITQLPGAGVDLLEGLSFFFFLDML